MHERRGGLFRLHGNLLNRLGVLCFAVTGVLCMGGGATIAFIPAWWAYGAGVTVGVVGGLAWGVAWMAWAYPREDYDAERADRYADVLADELAWLWDELDHAVLNSRSDWDGRCVAIADRIKLLTAITGEPHDWRNVANHLLEHGVYQRLHTEIGMQPDVDMEQVLQLADEIRAGLRITPRDFVMLTALAQGESPVDLFDGWADVLLSLERRGLAAITPQIDVDDGHPPFTVRGRGRGYLNQHRSDRRPSVAVVESGPIKLTKAAG